MAKRQSGKPSNSKAKELEVLWDKVFELERHVLDLSESVAEQLTEGKVLHPESELGMHLSGAVDEMNEAVGKAIDLEEAGK